MRIMGSILRNNRRMFWEILNRIGRKKIIGTGLRGIAGWMWVSGGVWQCLLAQSSTVATELANTGSLYKYIESGCYGRGAYMEDQHTVSTPVLWLQVYTLTEHMH